MGVVLVAGGLPAVAEQQETFTGAKWIWYSREPMPASIDFPAGAARFRGAIDLPAGARVESATLTLTADNLWLVHLNGKAVAASEMNPNAWNRARSVDVSALLRGGRNVVAVEAVNTAAGPAGLLASLHVRLAGGKQLSWHTGDSWKCSDGQQAKWLQPGFDDSTWQAAHVVGDFGMAPWGKLQTPATTASPGPFDTADLRRFRQLKATAIRGGAGGVPAPILREPRPDETWPDALVFVGGDCSLYRPPARSGDSRDSLSVTIFNPHHGRAYPEHDLPAPVKIGRKLMALRPARPGVEPQVLLDAGAGRGRTTGGVLRRPLDFLPDGQGRRRVFPYLSDTGRRRNARTTDRRAVPRHRPLRTSRRTAGVFLDPSRHLRGIPQSAIARVVHPRI